MNARTLSGLAASIALAALFAAAPGVAAQKRRPLPVAGVNLAGGEFSSKALPGRFETDYHYPAEREIGWAKAKGFAVVRIPFLWERIQPVIERDLDDAEMERLAGAVQRVRAAGLSVVLDLHNYGRWRGKPVGAGVSNQALADVWRRLAARFASDSRVAFGLMNEPHDMLVAGWAVSAQAAIDAVRETGACNLLLIPGANWTGAHSWNSTRDGVSNAAAMTNVVDKGPHLIEFHQYLDADFSGTVGACRKPEEVVAGLSVATDWLRANKRKGFLGEFGAGSDAQCQAGLDGMLRHMSENSDVWAGWTYWAAGAWWPADYPMSIEPLDGKDRPQMATLAKWIGATKMPGGCSAKKR